MLASEAPVFSISIGGAILAISGIGLAIGTANPGVAMLSGLTGAFAVYSGKLSI